MDAKFERGEKWNRVREIMEFEKRQKDLEWLDSQASIVEDIAYYQNSIKPQEKTKSKKEK